MKPGRVLSVIVIYETEPAESMALRSLLRSAALGQYDRGDLRVLVYDNTPGIQIPRGMPEDVLYYAAGCNNGVSGAYNYALKCALADQFEWLLLLDQDTSLPEDFVTQLLANVDNICANSEIAAIVPVVEGRGRHISPFWELFGAIPRPFGKSAGIAGREISAINSGACVRVTSARQIGGFSNEFWLDCCDFEFFKRLQVYGKRIYIAANIRVTHELSLLDMKHQMSYERYRDIVESQSRFRDIYATPVARGLFTFRLIVKWLIQRRQKYAADFAGLSLQSALARIFTSRATRARRWKERCLGRCGRPNDPVDREPVVSVCMATYNGETFIKEQLDSILAQLSASDELVIVDDASTDSTRSCIQAYGDQRILLVTHSANRGVNRSFEDALRQASGDIIFLSDQDDTWHPDKIATFLEEFRRFPEVDVVTCDARGIDQDGNQVFASWHQTRGGFSTRFWDNVWRSRYLGCTMAFRSRILPRILPLPTMPLMGHDLWIGLQNVLSGSRISYVHQALVAYRRHDHNVSRRLSLRMQVLKRATILVAIATRMIPGSPSS